MKLRRRRRIALWNSRWRDSCSRYRGRGHEGGVEGGGGKVSRSCLVFSSSHEKGTRKGYQVIRKVVEQVPHIWLNSQSCSSCSVPQERWRWVRVYDRTVSWAGDHLRIHSALLALIRGLAIVLGERQGGVGCTSVTSIAVIFSESLRRCCPWSRLLWEAGGSCVSE